MRNVKDIEKKVRLEYNNLLNTTVPSKDGRMPSLRCNLEVYPDYIAACNRPGEYNHTQLTAVGFYLWDNHFDDYNGLVNAIKYNVKDRLDFYKKKFFNVKMVISPDYSLIGNTYPCINEMRVFDARLVSLWFTNVIGAVVIPNITYTDESSFDIMISGLEECKVVCFSAMSCLGDGKEKDMLIKAIKYTVDNLNLRAIVVYSSSNDDDKIKKLFKYAVDKHIEIIIPDNSMRLSNRGERHG